MNAKKQDPVDAHVGQRLKLRRNMLGWSQEKLGDAIGVSFQMVQKYERGACRVGASRLMKISNALGAPVSWFFEGSGGGAKNLKVAEDRSAIDESKLTSKETLDLLKAFYALDDGMRKHVLGMVRGLDKKDAKKKSA